MDPILRHNFSLRRKTGASKFIMKARKTRIVVNLLNTYQFKQKHNCGKTKIWGEITL